MFFTINDESYKNYVQVPKSLLTDHTISDKVKIAYMLFLDRISLSVKNGWYNDEGYIYIVFSVEELQEKLGVTRSTAFVVLKEMEEHHMIKRVRRGNRLANHIYVENLFETNSPKNQMIEKKLHQLKKELSSTDLKPDLSSQDKQLESEKVTSNDSYPNNTERIILTEEINARAKEVSVKEDVQKQIRSQTLTKKYDPLVVSEVVNTISYVYEKPEDEFLPMGECILPIKEIQDRYRELKYADIVKVLKCIKGRVILNMRRYLMVCLYNVRYCNHHCEQITEKQEPIKKPVEFHSKPKMKPNQPFYNFESRDLTDTIRQLEALGI